MNRGAFFIAEVLFLKQADKQEFIASFYEAYNQEIVQVYDMKKSTIFFVQTEEDCCVVKLFKDYKRLEWQDKCMEQLLSKQTKGIIPFISNVHGKRMNEFQKKYYTVMPFIPARQMDHKNQLETVHGAQLLGYFHKQGNGIYGKRQVIPFESKIMRKCEQRLLDFDHSISRLDENNDNELHQVIRILAPETLQWAHIALERLPPAYLLYVEEQAQWERQIAHQDVVRHNFLILDQHSYYIIDYDLVDYAPPLMDLVQYFQDVLPTYNWSFNLLPYLLKEYQKYGDSTSVDLQIMILLLIYPFDIIREWNGIAQRKSGYHPEYAYHYFSTLKNNWSFRRQFVQDCLAMLK